MPTDVRRTATKSPAPGSDPLLSRLLTPSEGAKSPAPPQTGKRRAVKPPADLGALWSIARKTGVPPPR